MSEKVYRLIRSARKTIAIQILPTGDLVVRAPRQMPISVIEKFLQDKQSWIEKHRQTVPTGAAKLTEQELLALVKQAKEYLPGRVDAFARKLGATYGRITVRKQRTRWGSCSRQGNLSFNCLLMRMPGYVIDYIVVHELCHRKEMNHSKAFWTTVKTILPDYMAAKRWLKENGQALIAGLP